MSLTFAFLFVWHVTCMHMHVYMTAHVIVIGGSPVIRTFRFAAYPAAGVCVCVDVINHRLQVVPECGGNLLKFPVELELLLLTLHSDAYTTSGQSAAHITASCPVCTPTHPQSQRGRV